MRFVRWQVGSRLALGPIVVDFANNTKLVARPGMTGATMNIYVGLHEFHDMAFVLHFLRPGDGAVDIGANIGSYSILSASTGAAVVAFEPIDATFAVLRQNIAINQFGDQVQAQQAAIGAKPGTLRFTTSLDTMNHVATPQDADGVIEVPVMRLDDALSKTPILMKIDVEGYETDVIAGAERTLTDPSLQAVIMELNGSGARYGYDETPLHRRMIDLGFSPHVYDGLSRRFAALEGINAEKGNTLYLRDAAFAVERTATAPKFSVLNKHI